MKINLDFKTRQMMVVAFAIAEEVVNNTVFGGDFGFRQQNERRPVLLSVNKNTFRFESGTVVKLNVVELSQFVESWRTSPQEWVVTSATVRFYQLGQDCSRISETKKEEFWGHEKLKLLKEKRWWYHPHVRDVASITGDVHVFWDNSSRDGFTEVDPDKNQEGFYQSIETFSFARFIPGDLERAKKEADNYLTSCYKETSMQEKHFSENISGQEVPAWHNQADCCGLSAKNSGLITRKNGGSSPIEKK